MMANDSGKAERTGDPIIDSVINSTKRWNNKHFAKQPPIRIGRGRAYVVTYVGEDDYPRASYVYDAGGEPLVYEDLRHLILAHSQVNYLDERFILTASLALGFILLVGAVIYVVVAGEQGPNSQAVIGLAGSIVGYMIAVLGGRIGSADRTPQPEVSN